MQEEITSIEIAAILPQWTDEAIREVTIYCDSQEAFKTLDYKSIISKALFLWNIVDSTSNSAGYSDITMWK